MKLITLRFADFISQFRRLVLFVEKTTQKYQFSISNIIFLDVKPKISGIKSSLGYGVFYIGHEKHYMWYF